MTAGYESIAYREPVADLLDFMLRPDAGSFAEYHERNPHVWILFRRFMAEFPQHAGIFQTRASKADLEIAA